MASGLPTAENDAPARTRDFSSFHIREGPRGSLWLYTSVLLPSGRECKEWK